LYNAGVRVIEYTNGGSQALENFRHLRTITNKELPGLLLGAGTIKTRENAIDFIDAGADFIISPGLNDEVGVYANSRNILWVPGCMTPSEIMKAEELNAPLIKLFPGNLLGPAFLSSIKELFPGPMFVPTGGVKLEEESLKAWFKSGVIAVGAGSTLINKEYENGKFAVLEESTKKALALVNSVRSAMKRENSI
jgi:2-dehydro-3-deoxyphosphogluconate aldolase/(4S)-4-hydroxy-2-oxoglutarate aldolase